MKKHQSDPKLSLLCRTPSYFYNTLRSPIMNHGFNKVERMVLLLGFSLSLFFMSNVNGDEYRDERDKTNSHHNRSENSGPIALNKKNSLVWVVNPDTDSVSVISTENYNLVEKIKVGKDPRSISLSPSGEYAYVANSADNNIAVIRIRNSIPIAFKAYVDHTVGKNGYIATGSEPRGVVVSPDGKRIFVSNSSQDTITVINARNHQLIGSVNLRTSVCNSGDAERHFNPRGLAVTDDSNYLFVTRFLSFTHDEGQQAEDHGKEGLVCRLNIDTNAKSINAYYPDQAISLKPSDSGFPDKKGNPSYAYPNQLQSIVIRDGHAYLPNIAASPSGPLRFDNDTQAYVNSIDGVGLSETDAGAINLHLGARDPEIGKPELYFANPWGIAFTTQEGEGSAYVVSAGSDIVVKLNVNKDGVLSFTQDEDTTKYIDLNDPDNPSTSGFNAGKNPIGIVVDESGKKAYVLNAVSQNLSVLDLVTDTVAKVVKTDDHPKPGSREEVLKVGAEMFFTSRGNFERLPGANGSNRNRLSEKGHQNCASCHADGLTDGVIWQFNSGPRKTISINGTFNPHDSTDQRIINASAIFDEVEDADFNTRRVSSGEPLSAPRPCVDPSSPTPILTSTNDPDHGLILGEEDDFEFAPCVINQFVKPNAGRPQPKVVLPGSNVSVGTVNALVEWQKSAIRTPNRPMTREELLSAGGKDYQGSVDTATIEKGRNLFQLANCQSCHNGGKWTKSKKDFISPPNPAEIATEVGASNANQAQFLPRFLTDIGSYALNVKGGINSIPGYPQIGGIEKDTNNFDALGFDFNSDGKGSGFNTPSILGSYHIPPYYHNGACETLECVLADTKHRKAGLKPGEIDPLESYESRYLLARFLESIDTQTQPILAP